MYPLLNIILKAQKSKQPNNLGDFFAPWGDISNQNQL